MSDIEYLILTSIVPVGMLIVAGLLLYFTRDKPKHPHPGE